MNNMINNTIDDTAILLKANYDEQKLFDLSIGEKIPSRKAVETIIDKLRILTFPGFFGTENMAYVSKENFAGNTLAILYELLFKQIRTALSFGYMKDEDCDKVNDKATECALEFIKVIPDIQHMIMEDVKAEYDGDPAAMDMYDVILSYPGLYAIFVYRYAHKLYEMNIPYIPRIMSELAHGSTGIDINPGAKIGAYFCIDHGTGIVIGETTIIGSHVKIYQGVTLGALSTRKGQALSGVKRHPTIEDNVVIYANTTVLGGETVIGENSVIAGNSFITSSIPKNTRVITSAPEFTLHTKN
ncbi:MAG: serine O-acetyltransferase [Lachnospiraceae bacterium]|nr:serine O-acetyltransferase [Lachnospiraceae bacterium]